jgi:hypothetical protein
MKVGQFVISFEALAGHLGLPRDHEIVAIAPPTDTDIVNRRVRVLVAGPQMREPVEGGPAQIMDMIRDTSGRVHFE